MTSVDIERLPIDSPVQDLRREDERWRVTFTRLAGIYWLDEAVPGASKLMARLQQALDSRAEVHVTYRLPDKVLTGLRG